MDGREPVVDDPRARENLGRGGSVRLLGGFVLRRLLGQVDVHGPGQFGEPLQICRRDRTNRMDRGSHVDEALTWGLNGKFVGKGADEAGMPVHVSVDRAVAESGLFGRELGVDAPGEVAGVEQSDADPRRGGRPCQRSFHRVGAQFVIVRVPAGTCGVVVRLGDRTRRVPAGTFRAVRGSVLCMVDVVELPHRGVAAGEHLGEHGTGHGLVGLGVEFRGDGVHDFAPGPEGAAVAVGAAAQHPMEGMGVGVDSAGQDEPGHRLGVGGCGVDPGLDSGERSGVVGAQQDSVGDGSVDPGGFAPVAGAHRAPPAVEPPVMASARACSMPSSRARTLTSASTPSLWSSTSQASSGAWETPVGLRT